jgi:Amt family ammonium transporter
VPSALFIGFIAAVVSNLMAALIKRKTKLDDALDVFACHGLGGICGMLLTGVFSMVKPGESALFHTQFPIQFVGMLLAVTYSFIASYIIFKVINYILPMRVTQEEEAEGLDASQHDEKYMQGTLLVQNKNNGKMEEEMLEEGTYSKY